MVDPEEVENARLESLNEDADTLELLIDRQLKKGRYTVDIYSGFSSSAVEECLKRYHSKWDTQIHQGCAPFMLSFVVFTPKKDI